MTDRLARLFFLAVEALFFLPGHARLALWLDEIAEHEADDAAICAAGGRPQEPSR